jgi:hypothetical protein
LDHHVSPEIWSSIFSLCAVNDITLVCKRWTDIAYSSPALWTCVRITLAQCTTSGLAFHKDRLRRAKTLPLDIDIRLKATPDPLIIHDICLAIGAIKSLRISTALASTADQILKDIALQSPSTAHIFLFKSTTKPAAVLSRMIRHPASCWLPVETFCPRCDH